MHNMHCMVCNDPSRFRSKVNDAQRISRSLEQIIQKYGCLYDIKEYEDRQSMFEFDRQHSHVMCGHCSKINEQELRRAERDINSNLLKICSLITDESIDFTSGDYHLSLRLLAGHYPGKYRSLEKFYYKNKKNA